MNSVNTFFALMAEYGTAQIPVEKCASLFGLTPQKAMEYAGRQRLPVPAFRAGSQKSPWLVDAQKLADHLDSAKAKALDEWKRVHC